MSMAKAKGRVLVVDDEPSLRALYSEVLASEGFAVDQASTGREAMVLVGSSPYDVILSDIMMPDMNGVELLRTIRERDLDVPVLLMTGGPSVETAAQAVEFGAFKYLMKPVLGADLVAKVSQAVQLHQMARVKREALEHLGGEGRIIGDRAGLEATFGRALETLYMVYQPIVVAKDQRVCAYEALVRTTCRPMTLPGALFDAAERLGRLDDLGRAARCAVGQNLDSIVRRGRAFVNLHTKDLLDPQLFEQSDPLQRKPTSVVLEITERASLDGIPDVRGRVARLKEKGFRIAIDDLGAGYAGLTSFAALSPDIVKLDMALVRDADKEPVKRRLIQSMITLSRDLGIQSVAEGVETEAERDVLIGLGCDLLQGYLFGRPAAWEEWTSRHAADAANLE